MKELFGLCDWIIDLLGTTEFLDAPDLLDALDLFPQSFDLFQCDEHVHRRELRQVALWGEDSTEDPLESLIGDWLSLRASDALRGLRGSDEPLVPEANVTPLAFLRGVPTGWLGFES